MQPEGPPGGGTRDERELEAFLGGVRELAATYGERAMGLAAEPDTRPFVAHYTRVVQEQIGSLADQIVASVDDAPAEIRSQVDQILRMTAARTLVEGAMAPMKSMTSEAAFLPSGPLFRLIKKILDLILDFLLKKIGLTLPFSKDKLLELIDELIGEQANSVSDAAGERIHVSEVRALELQTHLARLEQAKGGTREREERNAG